MSDVRTLTTELWLGAARTDPGRARANNEDLPLIDPARGIYGVIDGVGGEAGGEVAAAIARDVILQRLARPLGTSAERIREAIAIANNEIFRRAQEAVELRGMACVITLAIVADGRLTIGHVGDTRLYKVRPDGMRKVTRDHSPVGEREDAGELAEADAMRHPRRNEVFRDVGSVYRDKDELEFVDIIEEPAERDCAILVCSDGLSDMLPSPTIAHIIRQHAGDPARVVDALVAAANDAGGKDNVTVVYAEAPQFAASLRGGSAETLTPTEPLPGAVGPERVAASGNDAGVLRRAGRAVVRSRTTWFTLGVLLGIAGAIAFMLYVAKTQVRTPQTHVVSADGSAGFRTIGEAMAIAQAGDVVRVEPGEYRERVVVTDGVDLVARIPGGVIVSRPEGLSAAQAGLDAGGLSPTRLSGLRVIAGPRTMPGASGIRIHGAGATLELIEVSGPLALGIDVDPGSSVTMQGSRVAVNGAGIAVAEGAQASMANNVFVRTATPAAPPVSAGESSRLSLTGNVFAGFDGELIAGLGAARRNELLSGNIVVPPPAPARRGAERRR